MRHRPIQLRIALTRPWAAHNRRDYLPDRSPMKRRFSALKTFLGRFSRDVSGLGSEVEKSPTSGSARSTDPTTASRARLTVQYTLQYDKWSNGDHCCFNMLASSTRNRQYPVILARYRLHDCSLVTVRVTRKTPEKNALHDKRGWAQKRGGRHIPHTFILQGRAFKSDPSG